MKDTGGTMQPRIHADLDLVGRPAEAALRTDGMSALKERAPGWLGEPYKARS
jgi:hypothetical protein